jgi:hypothetical protein
MIGLHEIEIGMLYPHVQLMGVNLVYHYEDRRGTITDIWDEADMALGLWVEDETEEQFIINMTDDLSDDRAWVIRMIRTQRRGIEPWHWYVYGSQGLDARPGVPGVRIGLAADTEPMFT